MDFTALSPSLKGIWMMLCVVCVEFALKFNCLGDGNEKNVVPKIQRSGKNVVSQTKLFDKLRLWVRVKVLAI